MSPRSHPLVVAVLLCALSSVAGAQAPGTTTGPQAPPQDEPEAASPASDIPEGVLEDANSGRVWMSPTALTPPRGTTSFTNWELFFVGGSYSPTDNLQLSAGTMVPVEPGELFPVTASAKLRLTGAGTLHVAAHAALYTVFADSDSATAATLGGIATACFDDACHSYVNGYLSAGFAIDDSDQSSVPFVVGGALVQKVSRLIKLMVEVDSAFVVGELNERSDVYLGWYGLRFSSPKIGVDFGLVRPFGDASWDVFPLGFPFVAFTYRAI